MGNLSFKITFKSGKELVFNTNEKLDFPEFMNTFLTRKFVVTPVCVINTDDIAFIEKM